MEKVWMITGCSTGIGRSLSEELLRRNQCVAATARRPDTLEDLKGKGEGNLLTVKLDITRSQEIFEAVKLVENHFGGIDVLVNNAGYGYYGTQEEADMEEVQRMFNTNVFGLARLSQSVLPLMRKRGCGTIVNISSVGGRVAFPFMGFYHASKHAVEALSEALYYETADFGIRVIIVEPGAHETSFSSSGVRAHQMNDLESPYAALKNKWSKIKEKMVQAKGDPFDVARAIIVSVENELPVQRIQVGKDAESLVKLRESACGDRRFFNQMCDLYGLGKKVVNEDKCKH